MENTKEKYFFKMGKGEKKEVELWISKVEPITERQEEFLNIVKEALCQIDYDYKISTIEPSLKCGRILAFKEGEVVGKLQWLNTWDEMAKEFAPENDSRLATVAELYLWYAYRIAKRYWSLTYVCDDSSRDGNYINSPKRSDFPLKTGQMFVGGFADGSGNSYKVVRTNDLEKFALCGGSDSSRGDDYPIADISYVNRTNYFLGVDEYTGVVVIFDKEPATTPVRPSRSKIIKEAYKKSK